MLKNDVLGLSFRTLMVSRLDGPGDRIATGLIDKAMEADKTGLKGIAYIDSRGIIRNDVYGHFDQSLCDLAMLRDGITATLGAVSEPYLHSFPEPRAFFAEMYQGNCLVEAYYRTKPFNSWQLLLIGDPLYRPFKKP